jgi:hypothetical protein
MSYYIPLPGLDDKGLGKAWEGLDVVSEIVTPLLRKRRAWQSVSSFQARG